MENSVSLKPGFEWKVANALSVDRVDSDEFSYDGHRWKLSLYADDSYRNINLSKTSSGNLINTYEVRCFIENTSEEHVMTSRHDLGTTFSTKEVWCIEKNTFDAKRNQYIKDGTLSFVITFTANCSEKDGINEKDSDKSIQTDVCMDTVACLESLSVDLHHLMENGAQSDVTLVCEEQSLPAHKDILSARSQVFSAMFRADMAENRSGNIEITDIDNSILNQFLLYIYSGKLSDLSEDTAPKLYAAADKYAVASLKKLCAKFMKENLTRDNACQTLALADMHGDKDLKDCAVRFIVTMDLLREKEIWDRFFDEHPKLAAEVLYQSYKSKLPSE